MIVIAVLSLTIFHPGFAFAGHWHEATWSLRGDKTALPSKKKGFKFWINPQSRTSGIELVGHGRAKEVDQESFEAIPYTSV
jgi:hypothetical protein